MDSTPSARQVARGFTLIEVVVAMAIGGLAIASGAALFSNLAGRTEAVRRAATGADYAANGERLLRSLLANIHFSSNREKALIGSPSDATFNSWCEAANGGLVRCAARLVADSASRPMAARLFVSAFDSVTTSRAPALAFDLLRGGQVSLRYLIDPATGGRWSAYWSELVPPHAVGIVVDGDTLIFAVAGGG